MSTPMKVLALNGSPRMKASSTYHMLKPLLEGMEADGAETEIIHIRKLKLESCIGCYTCWVRTPGECIHKDKDSMIAALESYHTADLVIFGTPLYHFTMSGIMKNFIDRTLPIHEPWLVPHESVPSMTGHPERYTNNRRALLVSPCGFPEFENFDALVYTFKFMAKMENIEYIGEILRPGGESLSHRELQGLFANYYDLLRETGEEIVRDGSISEETQAKLRKDLFPGGKEAFYSMADGHWTRQMDKFKVPNELRNPVNRTEFSAQPANGDEEKSVPEPKGTALPIDISQLNCHDTIAGMPYVFNADAADGLNADIQFLVSGEEPGTYYLHIEAGTCSFHEGEADSPSLTIKTPSEVWLSISRGELDGQSAFMQQKYTVEGDFSLLMKMNDLFKG